MMELTKAEEQLMQHVWVLKKAFLKEIVARFPEPRPAYTTISTVVGVLVKKGFLRYETFGKVRRYSPNISKEQYFNNHMNSVISNFFSGSVSKFAHFFTKNEQLNLTDLEEIKRLIERKIEDIKEDNV